MQRHPSLDDRFDLAIRIVDYDPAWPVTAAAEIRRIEHGLGPVAARVEHVGSTAVPGLAAKPIIDLQMSVISLRPVQRYADPLKRLGYLFFPDPELPRYPFFARPADRPRTHHLHVCEGESTEEFRHLMVRDFLRAHPDEAREYEALKRRLAAEHPEDRLAYIEGKDTFMAALEQRALTWTRKSVPPSGP